MYRALLLALLTGCGLPDADALYGMWANVDQGTVRAWHFADSLDVSGLEGQSDVFELYLYDEGADPTVVQLGTYEVKRAPLNAAEQEERPALVQHITWSVNSEEIGATYGNDLLHTSASRLVFASQTAESGKRTFDAVDELP